MAAAISRVEDDTHAQNANKQIQRSVWRPRCCAHHCHREHQRREHEYAEDARDFFRDLPHYESTAYSATIQFAIHPHQAPRHLAPHSLIAKKTPTCTGGRPQPYSCQSCVYRRPYTPRSTPECTVPTIDNPTAKQADPRAHAPLTSLPLFPRAMSDNTLHSRPLPRQPTQSPKSPFPPSQNQITSLRTPVINILAGDYAVECGGQKRCASSCFS